MDISLKTLMRRGCAACLTAAACLCAAFTAEAGKLVILHTNDTHSAIEPDAKGAGGIVQRKAVVDSVRKAEKNVIVVDAGDGVQGSLYFKLFHGDVDYPLMDMVGYDLRILGNHEFDNGLDELASHWRKVKGTPLSSNYDFSATPAKGIFKPWVIKKVEGKKIGFIALNIDPHSLIVEGNYSGMVYSDVLQTADSLASMLRHKKGCDLVVALTHIGYSVKGKVDDVELARHSRDIDIIIGGHSHTLVDPSRPDVNPWIVENADGKPVVVAQTGKGGKYVGRIEIDLDDLDDRDDDDRIEYSLIPVTDRFPAEALDTRMLSFLAPYREKVDSLNLHRVGVVRGEMKNGRSVGAMPNWTADFGSWYGKLLLDSLRALDPDVPQLDMAVMNVGGIRSSWEEGVLGEGQVLSTFPFANNMVVMRIKGRDLKEAMDIAGRKGGEAISHQARVVTDADGSLLEMYIDGRPVEDDRDYIVATINYIAWGNDDLLPMARGEWIAEDPHEVAAAYVRYIRELDSMGLPVQADPNPRFLKSTHVTNP